MGWKQPHRSISLPKGWWQQHTLTGYAFPLGGENLQPHFLAQGTQFHVHTHHAFASYLLGALVCCFPGCPNSLLSLTSVLPCSRTHTAALSPRKAPHTAPSFYPVLPTNHVAQDGRRNPQHEPEAWETKTSRLVTWWRWSPLIGWLHAAVPHSVVTFPESCESPGRWNLSAGTELRKRRSITFKWPLWKLRILDSNLEGCLSRAAQIEGRWENGSSQKLSLPLQLLVAVGELMSRRGLHQWDGATSHCSHSVTINRSVITTLPIWHS